MNETLLQAICLTALHNLSSHFSSVALYPCDNDVLELFLTKKSFRANKKQTRGWECYAF